MVVTATKFKANIGHFLDTLSMDEVYITKNGKMVAKLSNPMLDKLSILNSFVGLTKENPISLEDARTERIMRRVYPKENNPSAAYRADIPEQTKGLEK